MRIKKEVHGERQRSREFEGNEMYESKGKERLIKRQADGITEDA